VVTAVVVLNGGSSAGTTSIARALQQLLPQPWLTVGVDVLGDALPRSGPQALVTFGDRGEVLVAPGYRAVQRVWYRGLATVAAAGIGLVLDEVFLRGAAGQRELAEALTGLDVLWVGVHCDADVAAARELTRPDRVTGMAESQAELVHQGVVYDVEVDTTAASPSRCALQVLERMALADPTTSVGTGALE